jgi:hypothetical protein
VFLVSRSPTLPLVKSIVVVDAGVVAEVAVVGVTLDFFADLVSTLASFVSDVVVVFGVFGLLDVFAAVALFGACVTFAVVFVVLGEGVALTAFGAFGEETFAGAVPFPFWAASIGASVRHRHMTVPTVIGTTRMGSPRGPEVQRLHR